MGIEKVADRGSTQNNTSETSTLVDLAAGGSVGVGNYLIARVAGDNSGTSGVARTLTITDPRSNTWTVLGPANRTAGTASDGASTWICYAKVTNAYSNGDDITFNYSGAIVAKGIVVEEWRGIHATSPVAVASTTATGSSTTPSISRTPGGVGQMFYSALGIEGLAADTYTQDTDVVDGSWRTLTSITGGDTVTAATSITCRGAYKITGTAAQTWNPTITSRDWSQVALVFAPAWPVGVKGAHSVSADSSITTLSATVPENTATGDIAVAYVSYVATTQDCPTPSTGGTPWTLLDTQTPGSASARLYKKVMTTAEAGTALTFTNTTGQRLACGIVVLDGTLYSDVDVFTGAEETASTATHASPTSPTLTVAGIELAVFTERSSTPSASVAAPAGTSELSFSFGLGSGATGGAFAIDTTPVAAGATVGGGNWVASVANTACAMWTLAIKAVGAGVTLGLGTETDTALAIVQSKALTVGLPSEIDSAVAISAAKAATLGLSAETDSALAVAASKAATLGRATEADAALAVLASKAVALGLPTETDTARALTLAKTITLGVATETDSALPLVATRGAASLGRATETDAAPALGLTKLVTLGVATETDTALAISTSSIVGTVLGVATEADTALALIASKQIVLGVATETDSAPPLIGAKAVSLATAAEVDAAFALIVGVAPPPAPGHLIATASQSLAAADRSSVLTATTEPTSRLEASDGV